MKKFLTLLFAATLFLGFSASAQKMKGSGAKQVLIDSLKLSSAQADSVIAIRQRAMPQIKSIMSDNSLTKDQKKDKVKPIKDDVKNQLKKFLTNDQFMKLQEMEMEMKQNKSKDS